MRATTPCKMLRHCLPLLAGLFLGLFPGPASAQQTQTTADWRPAGSGQAPPAPAAPGSGGVILQPPQNAAPGAPMPGPGGVILQPPQPPPPLPAPTAPAVQVPPLRPTRVGQIKIIGNTRTLDSVILREIPLRPGQILSYPLLREAERNLARLNIFEVNPQTGVRPTVTDDNSNPSSEFKDIIVNVQETATSTLMFGVGVNSDAGLVGTLAFNERNFELLKFPQSWDDFVSGNAFRGGAQELRVEAVPGTQLQRYSIAWREPSIFDSPYSLGVSVYYYTRDYNEYNESRLGTRLTVGRKLDQIWSVSATLRLEDVGIHDVVSFAPEDFQAVVGDHFLGSLRPTLTRDTRDSIVRPTEGSLVQLSYEQFFGGYTFPQIVLEGTEFWTIYERPDGSGRQVLAGRSELGWSGDSTPVFERFYAGGFRSMRGFEFRGVGPATAGFEQGGDFIFLNSLEYQVPILANDHLYSVFFVDTGTVESSVEIKDYRIAVGTGLRILLPKLLGPVPIALDLGFPLVKGPEDKEQVFSFWIGFFR